MWDWAVYGGYNATEFTGRGKDMICRRGAFAGTGSPFSNFTVTNCDPDFAFGNLGTRVMWTPHPFIYFALGYTYWHMWGAHEGPGTLTANAGAIPAGPVRFGDADVHTFHIRVEYNMLP
jgi:hypothetical protein